MKRISRENHVYKFDSSLKPALEIDPGDEILVETYDAFTGRIDVSEPGRILDVTYPCASKEVTEQKIVNPVTGPIGIRGAEPGDTLMVTIKNIKLQGNAYIIVKAAHGGVLRTGVSDVPMARIVEVTSDKIIFNEKLKFPVRPMVGTIGTAPLEGSIASVLMGKHGGNMDNNDVTVGSSVYLPVYINGAHLALGDVHARMGDGETSTSGIDLRAEVTIRVDLLKGKKIRRPFIETPTSWVATSNAPTFEEALTTVVEEMASFLINKFQITRDDAARLITGFGDVKICQSALVPKFDMTMRLVFPKC